MRNLIPALASLALLGAFSLPGSARPLLGSVTPMQGIYDVKMTGTNYEAPSDLTKPYKNKKDSTPLKNLLTCTDSAATTDSDITMVGTLGEADAPVPMVDLAGKRRGSAYYMKSADGNISVSGTATINKDGVAKTFKGKGTIFNPVSGDIYPFNLTAKFQN